MGNVSRRKRGFAVITAVMIFISMYFTLAISENAFAESATGTKVTYKGAVSSMGSTCGKFTIKGRNAFCAEHPKTTPPTGTKIKSTKLVSNNKMRKALYYGYGGPAAKVSKSNSGWVSTSIALSRANGKGGGTTASKKFYNSLKNYATPPDSFKVYYCTTGSGKQALCYWIHQPKGKLSIEKESSDPNATSIKGYSVAGAIYGVYTNKACTDQYLTSKLTTEATGVSNKITLNKGTYYVKEITAPEGFALDSNIYTVSITDQCDKKISVKETPKTGKIKLIKSSAEPEITNGNNGYSLTGAVYGVWSDQLLTEKVGELTTNDNGESDVLSVLAGTYYIKETQAPKGFLKNDMIYEIEVSLDDISTVKTLNVKDVPEEEPEWVMIQKVDAESGKLVASGDGELAGAEFTVRYYEGTEWTEDPAESGIEDKGKWVFKTNESGYVRFDDKEHFVSGDQLYYNDLGEPTFPIGTITIQETKAPKGYNINKEVFVVKILNDDNAPGISLSQIPTLEVKEKPVRGDLEIIKTDSKTGKALSGVTFEVVDVSENKVVAVLVTDENGYATTASDMSPDGSLLYGDYIVREKEAPVGYVPLEDIEITIAKNREKLRLDIKNTPPEIRTTAIFKENGGKEILPGETITIVDEVKYKNLIPGNTYRLIGVLMDTSSRAPLLIGDEKVVTEVEFTAEEANGTVNMEFVLDASELSGKSVTVFEDLYLYDVKIASHADITDKGQTVSFIGVGDIEIYKGDSVTGMPLEGVKFEVIDKLSNQIVSTLITDENGYATTAVDDTAGGSLLYGDYIVRETEALPGYMDIEDIGVRLDDINQIMSLKIENTPVPVSGDTADTGDMMGRMIPLMISLVVISVIGALVTLKRRED